MQPLKISKPLSKSSHPRRYFIWAGIVGLLLLIAYLLTPFVIRSQRTLITQEIEDIQKSDPANLEKRLQGLFSATGGDQAVARVLAGHYSDISQHLKAAKTYEQARGSLLIESAEQYALLQDYKNVARVAKKATSQRPTADSLSWQGIAFLNQGDVDKGCEKSREAIAKDSNSIAAKRVERACGLMRSQEKNAWKLYETALLKSALESIRSEQAPTSAALLLLAKLDQQRGDSAVALESLDRAFKQTPADRGVLDAIIALCSQQTAPTSCSSLTSPVERAKELLPPR